MSLIITNIKQRADVSNVEVKSSLVLSSSTGALLPAGTEAVGGENWQPTEVEGDAYQQIVAMETVAADDHVPDGDVQREDAAEDMTSPAPGRQSTEEGDYDAGQVKEVADYTWIGGQAAGEQPDEDNELLEAGTTHQHRSPVNSTEPPAAYGHSPEPGILLHQFFPLWAIN